MDEDSDVSHALAAFGAPPLPYHRFGARRLPLPLQLPADAPAPVIVQSPPVLSQPSVQPQPPVPPQSLPEIFRFLAETTENDS